MRKQCLDIFAEQGLMFLSLALCSVRADEVGAGLVPGEMCPCGTCAFCTSCSVHRVLYMWLVAAARGAQGTVRTPWWHLLDESCSPLVHDIQ